MFHRILKILLRPVFWIYYKRIIVSGLENVPKEGAAILACNHPNSFLDALLVGAYCTRKIHFLARSDVFRSGWAAWILGQMSVIPVYRLQEGVENLDRNKDTFERCYEILRKGEVVLIFSEGLCIQEMRLRTLKKGTARIALEFAKEGASLKIIPVGSNYPNATKFREDYLVGFGVPFDANEYTALNAESSAKAITAFNKRLAEKLSEVVIDIRDKAHEREYELLVDMLVNENGPNLKALVTTVNDLQEAPVEHRRLVMEQLKTYRSSLTKYEVRDSVIKSNSTFYGMVWLYALLFIVNFIWHLIPVGASILLTKKVVKTREFYDSVLIGIAMIFNWAWLISWTIALTSMGPVMFAILVGTGILSVWSYIGMNAQWQVMKRTKIKELGSIKSLRQEILSHLG